MADKQAIECPVCHYQNVIQADRFTKEKRFFCAKCGSFLQRDNLTDKAVVKIPEQKMARIIENLKHVPHTKISWDHMADKYVTKVEQYKALYGLEDIAEDRQRDVVEKMDNFLQLCTTADFQIAFVGTIKTGKSTLINALLGKEYASMAVTPETAALTKFRSSEKDFVKVTFYNQEEWKQLWSTVTSAASTFTQEYEELQADKYKDQWIGHEVITRYVTNDGIKPELKKWSSSQCPEHYFVKEIEVGISNLDKAFPQHVVFVDTPGLSDPVPYRSEITKNYIKQANAVLVCVDAQKMYKEEKETIASVFDFSYKNKNKVHIVATHWDQLNNPEEDWQQQYEYLIKQLSGKAFFDDAKIARENILYSAAYIYNLCLDYDTLDNREKRTLRHFAENYEDTDHIDPSDLPACLPFIMEKTNILAVHRIIQEHLIRNYKVMLSEEIAARFVEIELHLKRTVREAKAQSEELVNTATADVDARIKKVETQKQNCTDIEFCQEELYKTLDNVDERTNEMLEQLIAKIQGKRPVHKTVNKRPVRQRKSILDKVSIGVKQFWKR